VSALYHLKPYWDLQINLHKCQIWRVNVQCVCLTNVGSKSRSVFNVKHFMTVFRFRSIYFDPFRDLQITLHKCQVWWVNVQCVCLTKVGSWSRSEIKVKHCMIVFCVRSISFEPQVSFTNYWAQMSSMISRCAGVCLTKVSSRSEFKVKHCITAFRVRSLSFDALVAFTNYSAQLSNMMRRCALRLFDHGRF